MKVVRYPDGSEVWSLRSGAVIGGVSPDAYGTWGWWGASTGGRHKRVADRDAAVACLRREAAVRLGQPVPA